MKFLALKKRCGKFPVSEIPSFDVSTKLALRAAGFWSDLFVLFRANLFWLGAERAFACKSNKQKNQTLWFDFLRPDFRIYHIQ